MMGAALVAAVMPGKATAGDLPLQAMFDAAMKTAVDGDCAGADPQFARLLADARVAPGSLPAAMILLHRGICHINNGDPDNGAAWIASGLPRVEQAGAALAADAARGHISLGELALHGYDHDAAVADFQRAEALGDPGSKVEAALGLAIATQFDGDGVSLAAIDRTLALIGQLGLAPAQVRKQEGYVRSVRVRALLNLGRYAEAFKEGERAIDLAGGLGLKVHLDDVSLRADVAEAALLSGRADKARELMAYTGAGRTAKAPFRTADKIDVPQCADTAGLRTDDSAVVQFAIADDGTVRDAQTVFTRGNYATARIFAMAVHNWVWRPEKIAELSAFDRKLVRVEVHCSLAGGGLPGITFPFVQRLSRWASNDPVSVATATEPERHRAQLRARAAEAEAVGQKSTAAVLRMIALLADPVSQPSALAEADHVVALSEGDDPARHASALAVRALVTLSAAPDHDPKASALLARTIADPAVVADALALNTLRLRALKVHTFGHYQSGDVALLKAVAEDSRLEPASPLRQIALLRLASLAADSGHRADAAALFARTGLDEQQCALIGDIPRLHAGNYDSLFPDEALHYGFEGWVKVEFNLEADGRPTQPRTLIAYPPFVFVPSATSIVRAFRYDTSFRPSGKLACSGKTESIAFGLPDAH